MVHNPESHPTDFFYYEIKKPKVMHIGDKITFKQKKFYVYSYEAEYVRGEFIYTYRLCREKGIWQEKLYNDKLIGISLEGKVLEVSGEQVKLHLDIDETQNQAKAAWFRYAPPTGNIMYSMPIVGTSVNLYFPNERNEEPIVIGCVRKNGSSCEKFSDVNNRYFSTESGNNLDLLPDAINFSRPGLSATFNDGGGINFNSSSTLNLNAGYVGLFAGDITIHGKSKIVAKKGGSFISLEGEIFNDAGIVMENGSDRASNSNFTDDDPQNGVTETKAAMEAAIQAAVGTIANAVQGAIGKIGSCLPIGTEAQAANETKNIKPNEKTLLESVLDFIMPPEKCYAATTENVSNNTDANSSNENFIENKVEDFIDECGKCINKTYNKIVGQEITLSDENVGDIEYSAKQKSNGDYIIQKVDRNLNFEGFSINDPIKIKVPFTKSDYIGINPSISFGKELEFSVEGSYNDGKTGYTKSGNLGISMSFDNISIFSEGKIENKDGLSENVKVTHGKIDWGTVCMAVGASVVTAGIILDPIPGDEAAIPALLELLGLKLAR